MIFCYGANVSIFFTFVEILREVRVFSNLDNLSIRKPVVTVGVFDGLHRGHQQLLGQLCSKAAEIGGESVVVTFWPHPRMVLENSGRNFFLLSTLEEKKHLLANWGIDNLIIIPFTKDFAGISANSFIADYLVGRIGMKYLFIGDGHRFGRGREGGLELVSALSRDHGFGFSRLESKIEGDERISSSLVREALNSGKLEEANRLLGFPYFMFGKVVEGYKLGRKLGFPTANIECCADNKQIPQDGVYVVRVEFNGHKRGGMLNIGTRPTVRDTREKSIEVHIFDIDGDLYRERLKVCFLYRLRDEMKFKNIEGLVEQLKMDKANAIKWLEENDLHQDK